MSFDTSRFTFDPFKDYSGVVMEQGRVQTDADWNEWLLELSRRLRAGTLDTMGHAVYPQTTPNAFLVAADGSAGSPTIRIGLGRMYVDGILVENHGPAATARWDPALAELSNTPQPQPSTPQTLDGTNSILFKDQPYSSGASTPAGPGVYVAYLDVWRRPITYIEDASLIDVAIGVDTTGRMQTAWRVGLLPLPVVSVAGSVTSGSFSPGDLVTQANSGATGVVVGAVPSGGPMLLSQLTGNANASDIWSNSGGAQFTPTAAPAGTGSYIAGSVASGTFQSGETVTQSGSGASATLAQAVPSAGPMIVGPVSGTPSPLAEWVGQTSGAVFNPVCLPSASSSTIAGAVSSGNFIPGEQVIQANTNASIVVIGAVPAAGPMLAGAITGSPDATDTWTGQQSKAVFTPTAVPVPASWNCSSSDYSLPWPASSGTLNTQPVSSTPSGPCCLTTGSGYTGPENQFYRIEIHTPGGASGAGATFKWSRENASVQTSVTAIGTAPNSLGAKSSSLTVQSLGRDQVLGFSAGDWIEITDESHDNSCMPGELYKVDHVDVPGSSIVLTTQLSASFTSATLGNNAYTRIIRWDQSGQVYKVAAGKQQPYYNLDTIPSGGTFPNGCLGIPVPADGSPIVLEGGIAIEFGLSLSNGSFQTMDFWNFTARASDGSIEVLKNAPPRGIAHHFTKLGIVTVPASGSASATDCRIAWPPASGEECGCCCSCTVGDGKNSFGTFTSIQKAIDSLQHGGEVCILAGDYYEYMTIENKRNIVIHGCGAQTRVYSPSLQTGAGTSQGSSSGTTAIGVPAVFSIAHSASIELCSLCVFAGDGEIGVLIDHLAPNAGQNQNVWSLLGAISNENITVSELNLSASTMPALAALAVSGLEACTNQVTMKSIASRFPAVYLAGQNIRFERNKVQIESNLAYFATENQSAIGKSTPELPLQGEQSGQFSAGSALAIGGVQVAGPSINVWIVENEITGGSRNGITLGNMIYLDAKGNEDLQMVAVLTEYEDACSKTANGTLPGSVTTGNQTNRVAAGGAIRNLHILRNNIRNTGMCGIGPVGFFDLNSVREIVSLTNVLIAQNLLVNTLSRALSPAALNASPYGYGVISLPDTQNLIVRDNIISDYGIAPGAEVCGIYVYHGEGVEIGRNQIRESRDLSAASQRAWKTYGGRRAGIYLELATPPTLDTSSDSVWTKSIQDVRVTDSSDAFRYQAPSYAPGLPALRIEDNVVRVAFGLALHARGTGAFSILGNHFSTGGTVTVNSEGISAFDFYNPSISEVGTPAAALTVAIVNLGIAVEMFDLLDSFKDMYTDQSGLTNENSDSLSVTSGTVLFSNNTCQLMTQLNQGRGLCSVGILTHDHLLFSNNELWINGARDSLLMDADLVGISVQAIGNRLQESLNSVTYSGYTHGTMNVTAHNISTYCLISKAQKAAWWIKSPNVVMNFARCKDLIAGK